ncbi:MAG: YgiT-type zinc finger protein [SAR324 cluster bacterium]|nr:YgiT-type zinc finger protein [SAR324 cluster bacterium]
MTFQCHVCGSQEAKQEFVQEVFQVNEKPVLVEHIPASVCRSCGEMVFSPETTEMIRKTLHGEAHPVRTMQMDVFNFGQFPEEVGVV